MKVIYKYQLGWDPVVSVEMPKGAKILSLQVQYNKACIWAMVDPYCVKEVRQFAFIGTGHKMRQEIVDGLKEFIGTVQLFGGEEVYHVFELKQ